MFVAGVDGCRAGWVAFKVEVPSFSTSVDVVDVPELLGSRPDDLLCLAIDIPMGLLNGSRACDKAARKLLGQPRGTSVFAAPCRAALSATTHAAASQMNRDKTGRGLSQLPPDCIRASGAVLSHGSMAGQSGVATCCRTCFPVWQAYAWCQLGGCLSREVSCWKPCADILNRRVGR
jgi:hypothetical protein